MGDSSSVAIASPRRFGRSARSLGWLPVVTLACVAACSIAEEPKRLHTDRPPPAASGAVIVDARQPLLPTFPCSRCHADRPADATPRKLTEFHTQKELHHGSQGGWCYRCHAKDNIDKLHVADGTLLSFDEAYELCGSCHGDKLRDWSNNLHGLTTGFWNGERHRRSCPACHDPHNPRFPLMTPEHAPQRPRIVPASDPHGEPHGAHQESH